VQSYNKYPSQKIEEEGKAETVTGNAHTRTTQTFITVIEIIAHFAFGKAERKKKGK